MEDDIINACGQQLLSDWDAAPAQRFFVHIVSCIFYSRGSFPASCFRHVSDEQWGHTDITHEHLLDSGKPLPSSKSLKDSILSQKGSFIYPRRSENYRLARFLDSLHDIFAAIQQRRLGRYRICLSRSKSQDPHALVELYDLIFRYTEGGSVFISVKWGGARGSTIPTGCQNPFNEFLRTRGPIAGTFYTHPFIYSNDGEPLQEKVDHSLGKFLRQAVPLLQRRPSSDGGRIGTLAYHSEADISEALRKASLNEIKNGCQEASLAEERGAFAQDIRESVLITLHGHHTKISKREDPDIMASSKPQSTMHEDLDRGQSRIDDPLSVYEEVSDQLPSTQLLSSPQLFTSKQYLKRPRVSSPNHLHSSSLLHSAGRPSKRRRGDHSITCHSVDNALHLDASQLQPLSSASGSTYGLAHAPATSDKA